MTLANRATQAVVLTVGNSSGTTTVSLTGNTNSNHISVTLAPGQTGVVTGGSGTVTFNIVMNGNNKSGTVTFTASSPCSKTASVNVN